MISGVVYLLRIFKMFHGLMNNPVYYEKLSEVTAPLSINSMNFGKTTVFITPK